MVPSGIRTRSMVIGVGVSNLEIFMRKQSNPKPRILKVAEVGDFWKKQTRPQIRLEGKWLAKAGILPNRHVLVRNPQPGVLVLHVVEKNA